MSPCEAPLWSRPSAKIECFRSHNGRLQRTTVLDVNLANNVSFEKWLHSEFIRGLTSPLKGVGADGQQEPVGVAVTRVGELHIVDDHSNRFLSTRKREGLTPSQPPHEQCRLRVVHWRDIKRLQFARLKCHHRYPSLAVKPFFSNSRIGTPSPHWGHAILL